MILEIIDTLIVMCATIYIIAVMCVIITLTFWLIDLVLFNGKITEKVENLFKRKRD